jgi:hypothetical protein
MRTFSFSSGGGQTNDRVCTGLPLDKQQQLSRKEPLTGKRCPWRSTTNRQLHTCSHAPSTQRPIRQPSFGSGLRPQESPGVASHICSHAPSTQRPMRQPSLGSGLTPQVRPGFESHICSHAPSTQRPTRQPSSGRGLRPHVRLLCAPVEAGGTAAIPINRIAQEHFAICIAVVSVEERASLQMKGRRHAHDLGGRPVY